MIPWQFAMGFIHSIILCACHHAWPYHPECNFNLVRKYFYCKFLSETTTACSAYCSQRVHSYLWVVMINSGTPSICHDNSCHHLLKNFEAPFSLDNLLSSGMSISGFHGTRSVMWSHLMEVVLIKPWRCLFKHLCSYKYCMMWNSAEPNRIMWVSHDQLCCMHHGKSQWQAGSPPQ